MKTPTRLAAIEFSPHFRLTAVAILTLLLTFGGVSPMTLAAPATSPSTASIQAQNVDWMSADTAATLDIGMDVLVPSWVPDPFGGVAPSVSASPGYYQLYWMIPGGAPTFLYIEGTAGGGLPAGSPANLNNALSINSSVQGWNAIHDLGIPAGSDTPIYDQVWWIANGVLYTVSSNNMTGTDTMSLANSLVVLQPPYAAPAPTDPPVPTDPPYVEPTLPVVTDTQSAPADTGTTDAGAVENTTDTSAVDTSADSSSSDSSGSDTAASTTSDSSQGDASAASGSGQSWSPGRYDSSVPSDGTNGPLPPVIGTDGTGGVYDTALPNIFARP